MIKIISTTFLFSFMLVKSFAQPASSKTEDSVGNSFQKIYEKSNPSLNYSYDELSQTHNYSDNWDFDGDGDPDSLLLIGNGGAHLYFHLMLVLSADHKTRDFPFLLNDFPFLSSIDLLNEEHSKNSLFPKFVIHDFNKDGRADIYLNSDTAFAAIPLKWKKRGLTSNQIVLVYEKKTITIKNYFKH